MANSFHTKMQHRRTPLKLEKKNAHGNCSSASNSFILFNESKNFVVFLENTTYVPKYTCIERVNNDGNNLLIKGIVGLDLRCQDISRQKTGH